RGGTRNSCGETHAVMARVLVAALVALIISLLAGPAFIDFLRRNEFGQQIRDDGPQHHSVKHGTPTMGGLLIVLAASVAFLATAAFLAPSVYALPALSICFAGLACAAIGFLDDCFKLRHRRSLGLNARWKMLLLLATTVMVCLAAHHQQLSHDVFVPIVDKSI